LSGTVWAFVPPSRDVRKVEFYLDDPSAKGDPFRTDKKAPFDLAGSGGLDTRKLADGPHSVTAKIKLRSGTKFVRAAFTVRNSSPGTPNPTPAQGLVVSRSADRSNPVELDGATASGTIWAFTARTQSVREVEFFIDDAARTGTPFRIEKSARSTSLAPPAWTRRPWPTARTR
jgi:hypothetical protein